MSLNDLRTHLHRTADRLRADYKLSAGYQHRGGRGEIREHFLNDWLRAFLPASLRVCKGEVVDCVGNRTPEFDAIVYLPSATPHLFSAADRVVVPVEEVLCVLEYKSSLKPSDIPEFDAKLKALGALERHYELPPHEIAYQRVLYGGQWKPPHLVVRADKSLGVIRPVDGGLISFESAAPATVESYFSTSPSKMFKALYSFSNALWSFGLLGQEEQRFHVTGPDSFVVFAQLLLLMVDHRNYWVRVAPDAHRYLIIALAAAAHDEMRNAYEQARKETEP